MNDTVHANAEDKRNHESDESNEWRKARTSDLGLGELKVRSSDHFVGFVGFVVPQLFRKKKIGTRYSCAIP